MELIPTQEEVLDLLRRTGALRHGHFETPAGIHLEEHLNVALAMRYHQHARTLGVALSRLVRGHSELRAMIHDLSIVSPDAGGIPVAYAMGEALHASQIYWAEREGRGAPLHFREGISEKKGEKVLLVDDTMHTGTRMTELRQYVESLGDQVVGIAVMVYQPLTETPSFDPLPFFYLARLDGKQYPNAGSCELCRAGAPLQKVRL